VDVINSVVGSGAESVTADVTTGGGDGDDCTGGLGVGVGRGGLDEGGACDGGVLDGGSGIGVEDGGSGGGLVTVLLLLMAATTTRYQRSGEDARSER
jgi:hypothetical protein